jgi:glycine betaine/choline ABC-type transport system substrate-binding protein
MRIPGLLTILLAAGVLAGCQERDTLKVGGKDFGESQVLSEMMAILAEAEGIPVTRLIGLGPTRLNMEALKRGDIDLYAEYNGTGLVMLGQPALVDGDAAQERVEELYAPLDISWGERFGFANNYGIVMRGEVAAGLGIERISDLAEHADELSIGIDADFESRPLDGFGPMVSRYGLSFGSVEVVTADRRPELYDMLLDGSIEVLEGFTTDGQISDYNLVLLEDDLEFFPVYEAAPFVRNDALARFPALREVFASLAGRIDEETMQELNRQVDLDGYSPGAVARAALVDMGLLDDATVEIAEPLRVAAPAFLSGDRETIDAVRAVRSAFPGRPVELVGAADPLNLVAGGEARLALVGSEEFFALDAAGDPMQRGVFEAVGVAGQTVLHLLALDPSLTDIRRAEAIATGPEGSASARTAEIIARGLDLDAELFKAATDAPDDLAEAIQASEADAAILMAPLGNPAVSRLVGGGARLISLRGWEDGVNLVRYPYLRQARIVAGTYDRQNQPVESLASQLVLAGPGAVERDAIGDQGPGASFTPRILPLGGDTVEAINAALPTRIDIDPSLPQAAVLAPRLPDPPAAVSPAPGVSLLSVLVLIMLGWMLWLYARPERR